MNNSLNLKALLEAIKELCKVTHPNDPEKAEYAIKCIHLYLKANYGSLNNASLIFEETNDSDEMQKMKSKFMIKMTEPDKNDSLGRNLMQKAREYELYTRFNKNADTLLNGDLDAENVAFQSYQDVISKEDFSNNYKNKSIKEMYASQKRVLSLDVIDQRRRSGIDTGTVDKNNNKIYLKKVINYSEFKNKNNEPYENDDERMSAMTHNYVADTEISGLHHSSILLLLSYIFNDDESIEKNIIFIMWWFKYTETHYKNFNLKKMLNELDGKSMAVVIRKFLYNLSSLYNTTLNNDNYKLINAKISGREEKSFSSPSINTVRKYITKKRDELFKLEPEVYI